MLVRLVCFEVSQYLWQKGCGKPKQTAKKRNHHALLSVFASLPIQIPKQPVSAPMQTDTKPDCCIVGSGKDMYQWVAWYVSTVTANIISLGSIFNWSIYEAVI
jgi:hypothetical protein